MKGVAIWILELQERPPLLCVVNEQRSLNQIGDGVVRGHEHRHWTQAVLDGDVEKEFSDSEGIGV